MSATVLALQASVPPPPPPALEPPPEMCLYRGRVIGLLRRYFRMSLEAGRLPSLVGRECFRARVSPYRMHTFEDVIIFVHDVEQVLRALDPFTRDLIARVVLQEYNYRDAARLLGCSARTVRRTVPQVLDQLAETFLHLGLLSDRKKPCQGVENADLSRNAENERK